MKLRRQLIALSPIYTEAKVREAMGILNMRHVLIDRSLESFLMGITLPSCQEFLKSQIEAYRKCNIPGPSKKKKIQRPISGNELSDTDPIKKAMFSIRKESYNDSLSSKDYEYGLSDW